MAIERGGRNDLRQRRAFQKLAQSPLQELQFLVGPGIVIDLGLGTIGVKINPASGLGFISDGLAIDLDTNPGLVFNAGGVKVLVDPAAHNLTSLSVTGLMTRSPLTTKGDIFVWDSGDTRLLVGPDGDILVADSTEPTGLKWSSIASGLPFINPGDLLTIDSGGNLIVLDIDPNDGYFLVVDSGQPSGLRWEFLLSQGQGGTGFGSYTNGQLLIGRTSTGGLSKNTLTAGIGVSIINGAGSITIGVTEQPGMVFISQIIASSSATVSFILTGYTSYMITVENLQPATDNTDLQVRVSTNGGSSYASGATDYVYQQLAGIGILPTSGSSGGAAQIVAAASWSNAANEKGGGEIRILGPANTSYTNILGQFVYIDQTPQIRFANVGGQYSFTTAVNAIQFFFSSGNVATGTFRLYGIR